MVGQAARVHARLGPAVSSCPAKANVPPHMHRVRIRPSLVSSVQGDESAAAAGAALDAS